MVIYLTDEQYKEMLDEGSKRDGEICGWIYFKHKASCFDLYCETITKDGKTDITYVEANDKDGCIYCDEEMINKFMEYGKRKKLTDDYNDCPNCDTPMIYHFNYCPKCGQVLEWEEK